jgi:xanthine/uracil permease
VRGGGPSSLTRQTLIFAVAVLIAAWAINSAMQMLVEVLPILLGLLGGLAVGTGAWALWRHRDRW